MVRNWSKMFLNVPKTITFTAWWPTNGENCSLFWKYISISINFQNRSRYPFQSNSQFIHSFILFMGFLLFYGLSGFHHSLYHCTELPNMGLDFVSNMYDLGLDLGFSTISVLLYCIWSSFGVDSIDLVISLSIFAWGLA